MSEMDISSSSNSSSSSSNGSDPPRYDSLIIVEQKELTEEASLPPGSYTNGNDFELQVQLGSSIGEHSISVGSDISIPEVAALNESLANENQAENASNQPASNSAERIISGANNLVTIDIFEDDDDDYDEDFDEEDDEDEDDAPMNIITSPVYASDASIVQPRSVPRNVDEAADAEAENITAKMQQLHRESLSRLYADMLAGTDENAITEDHARIMAAAATRLSSITASSAGGASSCNSSIMPSLFLAVPPVNRTPLSPSSSTAAAKYDRQTFLRTMQDNGSRSPLNVVIKENFELSTAELEDLVENLSWMFGDIDYLFCMSKLELEKLEYMCMIKFTTGDYVMQSKGLKCRDREHFLKYKPMEVMCSHYLYFMALMLLKKPANAYQVVKDMKASVSFINSTSKEGNEINEHPLPIVFDFIVKNSELFFNYVTGRTAFDSGDEVPSCDDWNAQQKLYLTLGCYIACDTIGEPMEFDVETFIDKMIYANIFMPEWGLYILEKIKRKPPHRRELFKSLESLIIDGLKQEDARCDRKNPSTFLYTLDYSSHMGVKEERGEGLMIKLRNFINTYGTVVRVRLDLAEILELCPPSPERNNLIRSCLERAVAINSLHAEANYRLGMYYYSGTDAASVPLCIRYLKASLTVDSSRFEAVMEYCQILMGKQFRLMSALSVAAAPPNARNVELDALEGNGHLCTFDVPSIIVGFTTGVGAKFWTLAQVAELRLLIFYSFMMTGADDDALKILLTIYRHNKIISNISNVHVVREKYEWASARVTLKHIVSVFTETYYELRQKEDNLRTSNKPSSSSTLSRRRTIEEGMKTMLRELISYFKDDLP